MQAITHRRYGPTHHLVSSEIDVPAIGDRQVLVRVRAAALHIGDVFGVTGSPFPVRMATGILRPKLGIPGLDVAGEVEAVGAAVTGVRPGDRVFGAGTGTAAEFAVSSEDQLVPMPEGVTFETAAAVPTSGLAALHGLRDAGRLQPGQRVLVNGASGGVGSFAVQIAKAMGAEVTGVTSSRNLETVSALGADRVIDYTTTDFSADGPLYDLILDNVENRSLADMRRALVPGGILVLNSGTGAAGLGMLIRLVRPLLVSPFTKHTMRRYLSNPNRDDLMVLHAYLESGAVRPLIDRTFPLAQAAAALRHIETGHARGKVVLAVT